MQFPIRIELHRSTLLPFLLVIFHGIAAACIVALPWPISWRLIVLLPIGGSLVYALRRPRIAGLRLAARDRLECLLADGSRVATKVRPDSSVYSRLIVLRVRLGEEKRTRSFIIFPDQVSAEDFRQLRLWLRWHAEPKDDGGTVF